MLVNMDFALGNEGGGTPEIKQAFTLSLSTNPSWTNVPTLNEDGLLVFTCTENYNMGWQNLTKGTSGDFITLDNTSYASLEVSAGDSVQVQSRSSLVRKIYGLIVS